MILQGGGAILLRVDPQEVTDRGAAAVVRLIQNEFDAGRIRQSWPGDDAPGQTAAQAS